VDMMTVGLTNDAQNDTYSGIEKLVGTSFGDILSGTNNAETLEGGAGDDFLFGQGGNDTIFGGLGHDTIRGGTGNDYIDGGGGLDTMTGEAGADQFVLWNGTAPDKIADFEHGVDKIVLQNFGANPFGSDGVLPTGYFYEGYDVDGDYYRSPTGNFDANASDH